MMLGRLKPATITCGFGETEEVDDVGTNFGRAVAVTAASADAPAPPDWQTERHGSFVTFVVETSEGCSQSG